MRAKRGQKKPVNIAALVGKFGMRPACPYCDCKQVIKKGNNRFACRKCKKTFVSPEKRKRAYFPKVK